VSSENNPCRSERKNAVTERAEAVRDEAMTPVVDRLIRDVEEWLGEQREEQQMEWFFGAVTSGGFALAGTVVGAVLGFILGLVGAEYRDHLARKRRKQELIERLISEVSLNRRELESAIAKGESGLNRPEGHLSDTVYAASAIELALLPREAREDVQSFYAVLREVTSMLGQAKAWDDMVLGPRQVLHGRFMESAREALSKAEKAYQKLDHLAT
jgi:hypothetical protein